MTIQNKGGYIINFGLERANKFREYAENGWDFSLELFDNYWKAGDKECFLLQFNPDDDDELSAIAIAQKKGGYHNTGAHNYKFSCFIFLNPPMKLSYLIEMLPNRLKKNVGKNTSGTGFNIPHKTWLKFLEILKREYPESAKAIDDLWQSVILSNDVFFDKNYVGLETRHDAIGLCLDAAGMDKNRRRYNGKLDKDNPFINFINDMPLQERDIIEYDRRIFESIFSNDNSYKKAYFNQYEHNLIVRTIDKGPLEHSLGVDLLIFNENFHSIVFVQYKCMELENKYWRYRPDKQFNKENKLMQDAEENLLSDKCDEYNKYYKLNTEAFYFKFCKRVSTGELYNGGLSKGIILGRADTQHFFKTKVAKGGKGGKYIGYENCRHHLCNSLFIDLIKDGWLGFSYQDDEQLTAIIKYIHKNCQNLVFGHIWTSNDENKI